MAKKINELYIGSDLLNDEGRDIKHPAFISEYRKPTTKKIQLQPIQFMGLDLETDHKTSELKLMGIYTDGIYHAHTMAFLHQLFFYVRKGILENKNLAYWSRLDPFVLFKLFLYSVPDYLMRETLTRFNNSSGEWNQKEKKWDVAPIVSVDMGTHQFGIVQAIRSSLKFFILQDGEIEYLWAYDIKQLYEKDLKTESGKRLSYYSKIDTSAHLVDWDKFKTDKIYREDIVLKSNELDARAVHDLALSIQDDFFKIFGFYPKSLVSSGALARAGIVASLYNEMNQSKEDQAILTELEIDKRVQSELNAMTFINFFEQWKTKYDPKLMKDFYCMTTESYSGGYIESIRYGSSQKDCAYADLASAYPGIIQELYDLRNATIEHGKGIPPHRNNAYIFIRGIVSVPLSVQFNPITIKHPIHKSTNIHAVGTYRASYIIEERDFMLTQGATFEDEEWYVVQTEGIKSPLGRIAQRLVKARAELKAQKSTSEYMAKLVVNSMYGITFEATPKFEDHESEQEIIINTEYPFREMIEPFTHSIDLKSMKSDLRYLKGTKALNMYKLWSGSSPMDAIGLELQNRGIYLQGTSPVEQFLEMVSLYEQKNEEKIIAPIHTIERVGYSAGEFFNPIYASYITALTRIKIAKAATEIENNGGKIIVIMTDSVLWEGTKEMLPSEMVREKKTLGFFETPSKIKDVVCLGTGRYGFKTPDGFQSVKQRGLNASEMLDANDEGVGELSWDKAIKIMKDYNGQSIKLKVRGLISPGVVLGNKKYKWNQIGLVVQEQRKVDALVGYNKRLFPEGVTSSDLQNGLITTQSLYFMPEGDQPIDQTLPLLREQVLNKEIITQEQRLKNNQKDNSKQYRETHKEKLNNTYNEKYKLARSYGKNSYDAKRLANMSIDALMDELGI